jgi:hypothetical protein
VFCRSVFITVNNAGMAASPSQHAGVVGGTLNSTYQLGAAIVLSITASLKANYIEPAPPGSNGHGVVRWKAFVPICLCFAADFD